MPPKSEFSHAEYEALAAFRYRLRQFLRFSEDRAHAAGISPQQYQALLAIKGFPAVGQMTIRELAEQLQIRHQSAVGLVDRLVLREFVLRKTVAADRREVHLILTDRGEKLLAGLSSAHKEQLRRIGPELESLLAHLHGGKTK